MPYTIHIKRRDDDAQLSPITLSEWRAAASRADGVRMADGAYHITNPKTDERITIRNAGGDAEVSFPDDGHDCAHFAGHPKVASRFERPVIFWLRPALSAGSLRELARELDARLVGDEGEIYD